jgi:hypothetical protein
MVSKNLSKGAHLDKLNVGSNFLATFGDFEGGGLEIFARALGRDRRRASARRRAVFRVQRHAATPHAGANPQGRSVFGGVLRALGGRLRALEAGYKLGFVVPFYQTEQQLSFN